MDPFTLLGLALGAGNLFFSAKPYLSNEVKPWSSEWYQLCTERFESFNPQTGIWFDFQGKRHFCRFKNVRK